jgi:hypothetical protein
MGWVKPEFEREEINRAGRILVASRYLSNEELEPKCRKLAGEGF